MSSRDFLPGGSVSEQFLRGAGFAGMRENTSNAGVMAGIREGGVRPSAAAPAGVLRKYARAFGPQSMAQSRAIGDPSSLEYLMAQEDQRRGGSYWQGRDKFKAQLMMAMKTAKLNYESVLGRVVDQMPIEVAQSAFGRVKRGDTGYLDAVKAAARQDKDIEANAGNPWMDPWVMTPVQEAARMVMTPGVKAGGALGEMIGTLTSTRRIENPIGGMPAEPEGAGMLGNVPMKYLVGRALHGMGGGPVAAGIYAAPLVQEGSDITSNYLRSLIQKDPKYAEQGAEGLKGLAQPFKEDPFGEAAFLLGSMGMPRRAPSFRRPLPGSNPMDWFDPAEPPPWRGPGGAGDFIDMPMPGDEMLALGTRGAVAEPPPAAPRAPRAPKPPKQSPPQTPLPFVPAGGNIEPTPTGTGPLVQPSPITAPAATFSPPAQPAPPPGEGLPQIDQVEHLPSEQFATSLGLPKLGDVLSWPKTLQEMEQAGSGKPLIHTTETAPWIGPIFQSIQKYDRAVQRIERIYQEQVASAKSQEKANEAARQAAQAIYELRTMDNEKYKGPVVVAKAASAAWSETAIRFNSGRAKAKNAGAIDTLQPAPPAASDAAVAKALQIAGEVPDVAAGTRAVRFLLEQGVPVDDAVAALEEYKAAPPAAAADFWDEFRSAIEFSGGEPPVIEGLAGPGDAGAPPKGPPPSWSSSQMDQPGGKKGKRGAFGGRVQPGSADAKVLAGLSALGLGAAFAPAALEWADENRELAAGGLTFALLAAAAALRRKGKAPAKPGDAPEPPDILDATDAEATRLATKLKWELRNGTADTMAALEDQAYQYYLAQFRRFRLGRTDWRNIQDARKIGDLSMQWEELVDKIDAGEIPYFPEEFPSDANVDRPHPEEEYPLATLNADVIEQQGRDVAREINRLRENIANRHEDYELRRNHAIGERVEANREELFGPETPDNIRADWEQRPPRLSDLLEDEPVEGPQKIEGHDALTDYAAPGAAGGRRLRHADFETTQVRRESPDWYRGKRRMDKGSIDHRVLLAAGGLLAGGPLIAGALKMVADQINDLTEGLDDGDADFFRLSDAAAVVLLAASAMAGGVAWKRIRQMAKPKAAMEALDAMGAEIQAGLSEETFTAKFASSDSQVQRLLGREVKNEILTVRGEGQYLAGMHGEALAAMLRKVPPQLLKAFVYGWQGDVHRNESKLAGYIRAGGGAPIPELEPVVNFLAGMSQHVTRLAWTANVAPVYDVRDLVNKETRTKLQGAPVKVYDPVNDEWVEGTLDPNSTGSAATIIGQQGQRINMVAGDHFISPSQVPHEQFLPSYLDPDIVEAVRGKGKGVLNWGPRTAYLEQLWSKVDDWLRQQATDPRQGFSQAEYDRMYSALSKEAEDIHASQYPDQAYAIDLRQGGVLADPSTVMLRQRPPSGWPDWMLEADILDMARRHLATTMRAIAIAQHFGGVGRDGHLAPRLKTRLVPQLQDLSAKQMSIVNDSLNVSLGGGRASWTTANWDTYHSIRKATALNAVLQLFSPVKGILQLSQLAPMAAQFGPKNVVAGAARLLTDSLSSAARDYKNWSGMTGAERRYSFEKMTRGGDFYERLLWEGTLDQNHMFTMVGDLSAENKGIEHVASKVLMLPGQMGFMDRGLRAWSAAAAEAWFKSTSGKVRAMAARGLSLDAIIRTDEGRFLHEFAEMTSQEIGQLMNAPPTRAHLLKIHRAGSITQGLPTPERMPPHATTNQHAKLWWQFNSFGYDMFKQGAWMVKEYSRGNWRPLTTFVVGAWLAGQTVPWLADIVDDKIGDYVRRFIADYDSETTRDERKDERADMDVAQRAFLDTLAVGMIPGMSYIPYIGTPGVSQGRIGSMPAASPAQAVLGLVGSVGASAGFGQGADDEKSAYEKGAEALGGGISPLRRELKYKRDTDK